MLAGMMDSYLADVMVLTTAVSLVALWVVSLAEKKAF